MKKYLEYSFLLLGMLVISIISGFILDLIFKPFSRGFVFESIMQFIGIVFVFLLLQITFYFSGNQK